MADQYRDVTSDRFLEATIGQAKNALFIGANGSIFYFVVTRLELGSLEFTSACVSGIITAILWFGSHYRSRNMMSLWNLFLGEIEEAERDIMVAVFSSEAFRTIERTRITGGKIFFALIVLVGIAWFVLGMDSILHTRWLWLSR